MTRINCGIKPRELSGPHLLAEHREIKRIPNCIRKGRYSMKNMPTDFTLGTGHVKFFYDKVGYLLERYSRIYDECVSRGYNVTPFFDAFEGIPENLFNFYKPKSKDRQITLQRLKEKDYDFYKNLR